MSGEERRFAASDIEAFLASAFVALHVPPGDARAVAQLMVRADLYGYGSHGTIRLRQYVNRLRDGGTNPRAKVTIAVEHAATVRTGLCPPIFPVFPSGERSVRRRRLGPPDRGRP